MLSSIRKFSFEHCDLPTMIENVGFLLRMWTINIDRKRTQGVPTFWYIVAWGAGVIYYYVYLVSILWFVIVRCQETGDLVAASVVFSLGTCSETGITKIIFMASHKETIKNIVDAYRAFDCTVEPKSRFSTNLLKNLRAVKKRAVLFWIFVFSNGVIYIIIPICLPGRHLEEDLHVLYGLEPMFESPNYEIAFILTAVGVYCSVLTATSTTAFLALFVGYVEAQLLALGGELDSLWEDTQTFYIEHIATAKTAINNKVQTQNEFIRKQLRDIVKKHIMDMSLLSQIMSVFRRALAVEFVFLTFGLISELLGGLENTYVQLPYTLTQAAMDCFIGQKLIDASLAFERAVYFCKWTNFDKSNQRTVYLMLMNSQKTLTLSLGGFTVLSFALFMSMLKSTYSVYTTLRTKI